MGSATAASGAVGLYHVENLTPDAKDKGPNTYYETLKWGKMVTEALEKVGKEEAAIPVYMFCANVVRDRVIEEEGELAGSLEEFQMDLNSSGALLFSVAAPSARRAGGDGRTKNRIVNSTIVTG